MYVCNIVQECLVQIILPDPCASRGFESKSPKTSSVACGASLAYHVIGYNRCSITSHDHFYSFLLCLLNETEKRLNFVECFFFFF